LEVSKGCPTGTLDFAALSVPGTEGGAGVATGFSEEGFSSARHADEVAPTDVNARPLQGVECLRVPFLVVSHAENQLHDRSFFCNLSTVMQDATVYMPRRKSP
jgi:hypothetical protein